MKRIDLGTKDSGPLCCPAMPEKGESRIHYPTTYVDVPGDAEALPKEGTITFQYRLCGVRQDYRGGEEAKSSSEMKLLAITDVVDGNGPGMKSAKDAMEEFMAGKDSEEEDED